VKIVLPAARNDFDNPVKDLTVGDKFFALGVIAVWLRTTIYKRASDLFLKSNRLNPFLSDIHNNLYGGDQFNNSISVYSELTFGIAEEEHKLTSSQIHWIEGSEEIHSS